MSMSGHSGAHADAMAAALRQWKAMSLAMQRAMLDAVHHGTVKTARCISGHFVESVTRTELHARGLLEPRTRWLTPMGLLVREAGLAEREAKP